jgi:phosphomevalonate kinase
VVWTGQEARTSSFLERVSALAAAQPTHYRILIDTMRAQAERFLRALEASDVPEIVASTHAYGEAMGALGVAADVPIITDTLRGVSELATAAGGAAKPSGAGGGDVALALFPDTSSEDRFRRMCQEHNFTLLLIELGAPGVRIEGAVPSSEASR